MHLSSGAGTAIAFKRDDRCSMRTQKRCNLLNDGMSIGRGYVARLPGLVARRLRGRPLPIQGELVSLNDRLLLCITANFAVDARNGSCASLQASVRNVRTPESYQIAALRPTTQGATNGRF